MIELAQTLITSYDLVPQTNPIVGPALFSACVKLIVRGSRGFCIFSSAPMFLYYDIVQENDDGNSRPFFENSTSDSAAQQIPQIGPKTSWVRESGPRDKQLDTKDWGSILRI